MICENIKWESLTYDELIHMIKFSQIELLARGTVTSCKNVFTNNRMDMEYITGYAKKDKNIFDNG